jgi:poly(hydroxyalkanoate) granule-associated protein
MLDAIKKTYLLGLGLATVTREKVEEVVDELVRRGEVAEKDRSHVVQDFMDRARDEQRRLTSSVKETVQKVVGELGVPGKAQFEELRRRVEDLEKQTHSHGASTDKAGNDSTAEGD